MCDSGLTPTGWQLQQFPEMFRDRLHQLHDGVPTDFFKPQSGAKLVLPGLDLSEVDEIVTYVARGMEPTRGFPEFMRAVQEIQKRRPKAHFVVVGDDRVAYGPKLPEGESYKAKMLAELDLDLDRLHFTGLLTYGDYLKVLRASSVHVYLTVPFVLSWSLLEALSTGCVVVGSNTQPVREVIENGVNGLLVDFFDIEAIADRVDEVLDRPDRMADLRKRARQMIMDRYALADLLPRHLSLIADIANGRTPEVAS